MSPLGFQWNLWFCEYKPKRKYKFAKYQQGLSLSKFNFLDLQFSLMIEEFTDFVVSGYKLHLRLLQKMFSIANGLLHFPVGSELRISDLDFLEIYSSRRGT